MITKKKIILEGTIPFTVWNLMSTSVKTSMIGLTDSLTLNQCTSLTLVLSFDWFELACGISISSTSNPLAQVQIFLSKYGWDEIAAAGNMLEHASISSFMEHVLDIQLRIKINEHCDCSCTAILVMTCHVYLVFTWYLFTSITWSNWVAYMATCHS